MTRFVIWRILQLPLILAVIYLVRHSRNSWRGWAPGSPFENNDRKLDPHRRTRIETTISCRHVV